MGQETILIVAVEEIAAILEANGYHTNDVADAPAALRYLQARPDCNLVLCNLNLPGIDGIALLKLLSQEHPGTPVVLLADGSPVSQAVETFRHGAFDFLTLPCNVTNLLASVSASLEHGRMRRQSLAYHQNLEDLIAERTVKLREAMASLERSYDVTLEAMGAALDLRDAETEGHSKRVTAYTIALARAMRLSSAEIKVIARGAFLHDIGKIAIPDSILLKPGKLSPQETEKMREHCLRGYEMVSKIPFLTEAAEIVYAHQESFDGSGYPRGLSGTDIPLGARIFAIADTLDAITSDRPYRKGSSFAVAITEIQRCRGRQFDPSIVDIFQSFPVETWISLRAASDQHFHTVELFQDIAA